MNSFINMKECFSVNQIISTEILFNNEKTLIPIDSSRFPYVILA